MKDETTTVNKNKIGVNSERPLPEPIVTKTLLEG
jgi:hypothetical protein